VCERRIAELTLACCLIVYLSLSLLQRADFWEERFHKRSYINMTYILIDASEGFDNVFNTTQKYARKAKKEIKSNWYKARVEVKRMRTQFEKASTPYIEKMHHGWNATKEQYRVHVKPEVDKGLSHIRPHYERHVVPMVHKARPMIREAKEKTVHTARLVQDHSRAAGTKVYSESVSHFGRACPVFLNAIYQMEKKLGAPAPRSIIEATRHACDEPDEAVSSFLKGLGLLLLFLLRRPIYYILSTLIGSVLRLLWFFNPLRILLSLLFSSRKSSSTDNKSKGKSKSTKTKSSSTTSSSAAGPNKAANKSNNTQKTTNGSAQDKKQTTTAASPTTTTATKPVVVVKKEVKTTTPTTTTAAVKTEVKPVVVAKAEVKPGGVVKTEVKTIATNKPGTKTATTSTNTSTSTKKK
jgi:hypothetical protein